MLLLAQANSRRTRLSAEAQRQAQALLTELGYDPGGVDGVWGSRSQQALVDFRRDTGEALRGPLVAEDITRLEERKTALLVEAEAVSVATTLTLFGNRFDLAALPEDSDVSWADVPARLLTALPFSQTLTLPPEAARARVTGRREAVGRAFRADVETLFALADPEVTAEVADLDSRIADALYERRGASLARLRGLGALGSAGARDLIRRAEGSAADLLALDALAEHTLLVVPEDAEADAAQSASRPAPSGPDPLDLPPPRLTALPAPSAGPAPASGGLILPHLSQTSCAGAAGLGILEAASTSGDITQDRQTADLCFLAAEGVLTARAPLDGYAPVEGGGEGLTRYRSRDGGAGRLELIDHFLAGGRPSTSGAKALTLSDSRDGGVRIRFGSVGLPAYTGRPPTGRYEIAGLAFSEFFYERKAADELMVAPFLAGTLSVGPERIAARLTDDNSDGPGLNSTLALEIRHIGAGQLVFDGTMRLENPDTQTGGPETFATAEIRFTQGRGRSVGLQGQSLYLLGTGEVAYTARSGQIYRSWMTLHLYAERGGS